MPTGSKKIKTAAFIAEFTCTFTAIMILYLLIDYSNLSDVIKNRFDQSRRTTFGVLLAVYALGHIYRCVIASYSYRKAPLPDKSHKIFYNAAVSLVLSVIWFVIVLDQLINKRWIMMYKNADVIFFVMSMADIALFFVMTYGANQNRKQIYSSDSLYSIPGAEHDRLPPVDVNAIGNRQTGNMDTRK